MNPHTLIPILWSNKTEEDSSPKFLEDERGRYSLPKPLKKHSQRLKQNENMRPIYLNGEILRNNDHRGCNAFALLKLGGKVCYIGRVGKGSLAIWEAHGQGLKYGPKKQFEILPPRKDHIQNM